MKELEKIGITGLSTSHGDILAMLSKGERIPMKEISRRIDRKKNTVTVLVEKLIRMGYVRKQTSEADSRVTFVVLTAKGKSLLPDFNHISALLLEKTYRGFTNEEKKTLIQLLTRVLNNLSSSESDLP